MECLKLELCYYERVGNHWLQTLLCKIFSKIVDRVSSSSMCYDGILMCPCCLFVRVCVRTDEQSESVACEHLASTWTRKHFHFRNIKTITDPRSTTTCISTTNIHLLQLSTYHSYGFLLSLTAIISTTNLTIFCSLSSNLEKLRVLLHDVEQNAVYVFSQVDVDILLVLQRFPHLKWKVHVKQNSKRKSWFFTGVPSFTSCLSTLDCFMFHSCKLTWRTGFNAIKTRAMQSFLM